MRLTYPSLEWRIKLDQPHQPHLAPPPVALLGQERAQNALEAAWSSQQHLQVLGGRWALAQTQAWLKQQGVLVLHEGLPTLLRLFGGWGFQADKTPGPVIAGSMQKAAGGVLLLEAESLLAEQSAPELIQALFSGQIDAWGGRWPWQLPSLEVPPQPLQCLVWVFGEPPALERLMELPGAEQAWAMWAEFDPLVPVSLGLLESLGGYLRQQGLQPTLGASAALLDYARHQAGDVNLAYLDWPDLLSIAREAKPLTQEQVTKVLQQRQQRAFASEALFLRDLQGGVVWLELTGKQVGQLNGLVVLESEPAWGRPVRVTARAAPGRDGVLSIDREVGLAGQIFHKALLTLSSYLRAHYADIGPLSAAVSVVLEQNYGHIEGDSAGLAELLAVLSAIGEFELRQDLAVTGATDQMGNVLAVGGVTQKVEGFFRACSALGLSGSQGVVLPKGNLNQLTLSTEVLEAIKQNRFHLYAVSTADEALELLSGMRGFRNVHEQVRQGLERFAKLDDSTEA